jgi:hypothetical protein
VIAESAIGRISAACGNSSKRNSFINMTMKYAHIGIVDQAKAVAKLPAPGNGALHFRRRSVSFAVIRWQSRRSREKRKPLR